MREYIIHYQTVGSELQSEIKVQAITLQDAVIIFRRENAESIILNVEGPYDIR
jgi:hypothetical protein